jgi:hypothetical protein
MGNNKLANSFQRHLCRDITWIEAFEIVNHDQSNYISPEEQPGKIVSLPPRSHIYATTGAHDSLYQVEQLEPHEGSENHHNSCWRYP